MRRVAAPLLLIVAAAVGSTGPAAAQPVVAATSAAVPGCDDPSRPVGDLDGDGVPEVVVGVPTHPGGGVVDVRFTGGGGLLVTAQTLGVWTPAGSDRFGAAVVVSELNGDRCADLVIGAPGHAGTGAVVVAMGSAEGWRPAEASLLPPATRKSGAQFGEALAIFNGYEPVQPVLAVGMPGYPVNGRADAGAVVGYPVPNGVPGAPVSVTEDTPGVAGTAESGDRLGAVLAPADGFGVLAGLPSEDVGTRVDAGAVLTLGLRNGRWAGGVWTEDSPGVPGVVEAGDRFGAAVLGAGAPFDVNDVQMTVGVPGEDVGGRPDVGTAVSVVATGEDQVVLLLHQDGTWEGQPVPGSGAGGDRFGSSLAQRVGPEGFGVVVGVPGKDVGSSRDAGAAVTFDSGRGNPSTMSVLTEADVVGGHVEAGDRFASTLAGGPTQEPPGATFPFVWRLLVGVPGEDVHGLRDAGAVAYSTDGGPMRAVTLSTGARSGLSYGAVLATPTSSS